MSKEKNSDNNAVIKQKNQIAGENRLDRIYFRPHHFMCTLSFKGRGYSLGFVRNYKKIHQQLLNNEDTIIEVVEYMDDICHACPHKIDEVICKTQDKILSLDKAHKKVLQLKHGERLSWKSAKQRIKKYMTIENFHKSCEGCQWKRFGVCEQSLKELLIK